MKRILLLLILSLLINLVYAEGDSLAPYEMHIDQVGEFIVDYIVYSHDDPIWLFSHIESEDNRYIDNISYPNYQMVEIGDNYYIDTWISPAGRMYHILMFGKDWVLDAVVYKVINDDALEYKPICINKGHNPKIKKKCNENKS